MMKNVAVLISDVHFSVGTLKEASYALMAARNKAYELNIPLIIAGDLLDTKAIIRAECANALISILSSLDNKPVETYVIVGNHDLVNEKGAEHALNFLKPYCRVVDSPIFASNVNSWLIPYFSDLNALKAFISKNCPIGNRLIMHQGVETANMGHYIQDKTSLPKETFENYRVISGHYHARQDIKCGRPRKNAVGLFSYIGNPYTLSFTEAKDPIKGYQILKDDGLLYHVALPLRAHVVIEKTVDNLTNQLIENVNKNDIICLKITGPKSELNKINKQLLGNYMFGHSNYKLDLIPTDRTEVETPTINKSPSALLDALIDALPETDSQKTQLKALWRELCD